MPDRLEKLFELRMLWSRAAGSEVGLCTADRSRLIRLQLDFEPGVPSLDDRDSFTRLSVPLPAHLMIDGHYHAGLVGNVAAEGVAVACTATPPLNHWVNLTICDNQHGIEYMFPSRVVSRVISGSPWLGLRFMGAPGQHRVEGRNSGVWSDPNASKASPAPIPLGHRHRRVADE